MHQIVVLVRPGVLSFELSLVHRLFGQARSEEGDVLYEVITCAVTLGTVTTDADFTIEVSRGVDAVRSADTVVVPGSARDFGPGGYVPDPAVTDALGRRPVGSRVASICSGAFVLAAAGLLDGRRATTHWRSVDALRDRHPDVLLDPDVLYTDDRGVLTSAGAAAGVDLCLHMIREDHGVAVANDVARGSVVPPHRSGGQAQYITRPVPDPAVSTTGKARAWALANLHRPVSLHDLARQQSTSVRTFTRRFREETGTSPSEWVARERLNRACGLLEQSDLSVDEVAAAAGFGSATSMRALFQSELAVSPSGYRATFRGTRSARSGS